jgi:uncharacterized protein YeaO (DUF488 family)
LRDVRDESVNPPISDVRGRLRRQPVTLLYAARDETRNNAVALKAWLERLN